MNNTQYSLAACYFKQEFNDTEKFFRCYLYLAQKDITQTIFQIMLSLLSFIANTAIIFFIIKRPFKNVFDHILLGCCLVEAMTAAFNIPLFHIYVLFKYWPLMSSLAYVWSIFDNSINTITNLHMLYISLAKLRSIQAPTTYHKEILFRKPYLVIGIIWLFGLITWIIIVKYFDLSPFTMQVNYKPDFIRNIVNLFFWLLPNTHFSCISKCYL